MSIDFGFTCSGAPSVCISTCGDAKMALNEGCDDGSNDGIGCASSCTGPAPGYFCSGNNPTVCTSTCGNGANDTTVTPVYTEMCDDNNVANSDGCSSTCSTESGWNCVGFPSTCSTVCGDGIIAGSEVCDDSNTISLDGCASDCLVIEFGFTCSGAPSSCISTCGDAKMATNEGCDDGTNDGIGCANSCTGPAAGYFCTGNNPTICTN